MIHSNLEIISNPTRNAASLMLKTFRLLLYTTRIIAATESLNGHSEFLFTSIKFKRELINEYMRLIDVMKQSCPKC